MKTAYSVQGEKLRAEEGHDCHDVFTAFITHVNSKLQRQASIQNIIKYRDGEMRKRPVSTETICEFTVMVLESDFSGYSDGAMYHKSDFILVSLRISGQEQRPALQEP